MATLCKFCEEIGLEVAEARVSSRLGVTAAFCRLDDADAWLADIEAGKLL
jgi:hypothetical protein